MGRYADAVTRILLEQGQAQAQGQLARGQAWGQMAQQLGQIPSQVIAQQQQLQDVQQRRVMNEQAIASSKALAEQRQAEVAREQTLTKQDAALRQYFTDLGDQPVDHQAVMRIVGPERGAKIAEGFSAMRKLQRDDETAGQQEMHKVMLGFSALSDSQRADAWPGTRATFIRKGYMQPADAPETYDPAWYQQRVAYGVEQAKVGTREIKLRKPDGSEEIQIVKDEPTTTPFTSAPPKPPEHTVVVPGPHGPVTRLATEEELRQGVPTYRAPTAAPADRAPFWVNRGGKMIRITEAQYQPGDLPASTREQGRSVTAADASDLADFDTSRDELAAVRAAITPADSTGLVAQAGAKLPYVTQLTGWGTDAKKRQAVIDRVKQVIGKTLEGGVLRKEDEVKYEKILPTIGDAPAVALEKLNGLDAAIAKRKGRRLDSLEDANYDVTKYRVRAPAAPAAPAPVATAGVVRARDASGVLHEAPAGTPLPPSWKVEP